MATPRIVRVCVYSAGMYTLSKDNEYREEIKRSRFIALARPVANAEEAMAFFDECSDASARHNCWAYKVGRDYRFNDDGEPSGTAGKPILSAIEYAEMTNVAVLVIRWFGGIKLGTGGLSRAYGGTASSCLNEAEKEEIKHFVEFRVQAPFSLTGAIHNLLNSSRVNKLSETYTDRGIEFELSLEEDHFSKFQQDLSEVTNGAIECQLEK